jgi:hypothetical protein
MAVREVPHYSPLDWRPAAQGTGSRGMICRQRMAGVDVQGTDSSGGSRARRRRARPALPAGTRTPTGGPRPRGTRGPEFRPDYAFGWAVRAASPARFTITMTAMMVMIMA